MTSFSEGHVIAGKYRLEGQLGAGGMGAVWRARHLQLDVTLAIKCIDPDLAHAAEVRARFEREAKACAGLKSPHVVQVHDYGIEQGTPYLVMELLEGEDLKARLRRTPRLDLASAAVIFSQLCKGMRHAHDAGIIHRDLKPANIFLARVHGEEIVKVVDFGIAKEAGFGKNDQVTRSGTLVGTPSYMSPEQVRNNRALDARSDLWALGVILYRVVTGKLPFEGDDVADLIVRICTDPVPPASSLAPDLPKALDAFFERAMERQPEKRFQSAREMSDAFAAIAGTATDSSGAAQGFSAAKVSTGEPATPRASHDRTLDISQVSPVTGATPWGTALPSVSIPEPSPGAPPPLPRPKRNVGMIVTIVLGVIVIVGSTSLALWQSAGARDRSAARAIEAAATAPPTTTTPKVEPAEPTPEVVPAESAVPSASAAPPAAATMHHPSSPPVLGAKTAAPKPAATAKSPSMFGF